WIMPDGGVGGVPLTVPNGLSPPDDVQPFNTAQVWRGAEMITVNNFIYQGDEGNQDAGEVNGQMRAYGNHLIGNQTFGQPEVHPELTAVDVRLVNIFNGHLDNPAAPFDQFPGQGFNPAATPPPGGGEPPVVPWVAKWTFPLGRGSDIDAQTPGTTYRIDVFADYQGAATGPNTGAVSNDLMAGQFDMDVNTGEGAYRDPPHTSADT